jgi:hypothetical protein
MKEIYTDPWRFIFKRYFFAIEKRTGVRFSKNPLRKRVFVVNGEKITFKNETPQVYHSLSDFAKLGTL